MILNRCKIYLRGMGLIELLVALALFFTVFLVMGQWVSYQQKSAVNIYRFYQAVQIAENQQQRQLIGLACHPQVRRNQLTFHIACDRNKVTVSYLGGKVVL